MVAGGEDNCGGGSCARVHTQWGDGEDLLNEAVPWLVVSFLEFLCTNIYLNKNKHKFEQILESARMW